MRARSCLLATAVLALTFVTWFAAAPAAQTSSTTSNPDSRVPNPGANPLIRLDVHATGDGHPVSDLALADFTLVEDNAPQKLESAMPVANLARSFVVFLDTNHMRFEG